MNIPPELYGYAGSVIGISLMMPQAWKMWRTKSVRDISAAMLVLYFFNCFFWLLYGLSMPSLPLIITNAICLVVAVVQITLKFLYRDNS